MATYIMLNHFTEQGIRGIRETTSRADAVRETARKMGVSVREIYWTMGQYDSVALFDAPDEATMTAFALALGQAGNIRTEILRAFNREEMKDVLKRVTQRDAVPA
jgi:uncharacterized protein with GYD domain